MNLTEFKKKFDKLKKMDFVKSMRSGPTGVGHTLEALLELKENNVALPDLGKIELKAHRSNSSSLITLFTFNRKAWKMNPLEAIKKYGTPDKDGRLGLYFTMSRTPNGAGLFLKVEEELISVRHDSGEVLAEWNIEDLAERFIKKIPSMLLVSARAEMRGESEWFSFYRAQLLSGTSADIIRSQLIDGNVLVDLRLHAKETSARNHGTAFRAKEGKLSLLFSTVKDI